MQEGLGASKPEIFKEKWLNLEYFQFRDRYFTIFIIYIITSHLKSIGLKCRKMKNISPPQKKYLYIIPPPSTIVKIMGVFQVSLHTPLKRHNLA